MTTIQPASRFGVELSRDPASLRGNHAFVTNQAWYTPVGTHPRPDPDADPCALPGTRMFDEVGAPVRNQGPVAVTRENKQWFLELIRTAMISTRTDLELESLPSEADFTSEIRLVLPFGILPLATTDEVGRVMRLDPVPAGVEQLFEIVVQEAGATFRTGPPTGTLMAWPKPPSCALAPAPGPLALKT
jgi:hypothetical protein